MELYLVVIAGFDATAPFLRLTEGREFSFGRAASADIAIRDPYVAKYQGDIELRDGKAWLRDYGRRRGQGRDKIVAINEDFISSTDDDLLVETSELASNGPEYVFVNGSFQLRENRRPDYDEPTWYQLSCGDVIRIGAVTFRLQASLEGNEGTIQNRNHKATEDTE